jgi:hypothetical protein
MCKPCFVGFRSEFVNVPVNDFLNDQNGMFVQHKRQILPKEENENATFPLVRLLF